MAEHHRQRNNPEGEAAAYHRLGVIAQEQRDYVGAARWYQQLLHITEKQGNEHGAASTYCQRGLFHGQNEDYLSGGQWFVRGMAAYARTNDSYNATHAARAFRQLWDNATADEQAVLRAAWEAAGLTDYFGAAAADYRPPPEASPDQWRRIRELRTYGPMP